jgi:hypothetical protein
VPPVLQRKLIDGVWRRAIHCPTAAAYRSYRRRQRFVTFQPYMHLGALYMREGLGSGVAVVGGVPSMTLEFSDSAALKTVAEVRKASMTILVQSVVQFSTDEISSLLVIILSTHCSFESPLLPHVAVAAALACGSIPCTYSSANN